MNRHVALVGALTALALLLPATAALAEPSLEVLAPAKNVVLADPDAAIVIEVRSGGDNYFECPEPEQGVRVRLADLSGDHLSDTQLQLSPQSECELGDRAQVWVSDQALRPSTLAPFEAVERVCNGGYQIQASSVTRSGQQMQASGRFSLQLPPSAPTDVTVTTGVERATVEWSPAPEPDVTGYRVVRGDLDDPDWEAVVGPDVTTAEDADAPAGEHEYRVATLRADGLVDGKPVKPCTDDGQDLQTTSAAVPATVDAPATESETPSESVSATESESATETESETATPTPTPTPEDDPEPEPEPVPVETTDPEPTEVETTDPEYDEHLDFSGVGPSSPDDDPDGGAVALDVPGGSSQMDELLGPILRPVAGGMILLVFALHLRRWSRDVW